MRVLHEDGVDAWATSDGGSVDLVDAPVTLPRCIKAAVETRLIAGIVQIVKERHQRITGDRPVVLRVCASWEIEDLEGHPVELERTTMTRCLSVSLRIGGKQPRRLETP